MAAVAAGGGRPTVAGVTDLTAQRRRTAGELDAVCVAGIAAAWILLVHTVTGGQRVVLFDTFRDMAWALNIRAGRIWEDPTLPGYPYWYAPGNPMLAALLARLTGLSEIDLYGYAGYWCNLLTPIALFLLVRSAFDRLTGLLACLTVHVGSFLLLAHAAAAVPSVQGLALNLLGLWAWHSCVRQATAPSRGGWRTAVMTGALMALSAWYHPLCAIIFAGAVLLHAMADALVPGLGTAPLPVTARRRAVLPLRMLVVGMVAAVLAAPLMWHMLRLHGGNPALLRWFGEELVEPRFYAQCLAPLLVPAALYGTWTLVRRHPTTFWLVAYLLVSLAGQVEAFIARMPGWELPYVLPHEFMWHTQLALGMLAAVGVVGAARAWLARGPAAVAFAVVMLAALVAGPGLRGLAGANHYLLKLDPLLEQTREVRAWICAHTELDAVFVSAPDPGYQVVAALTGRKCIALSEGHMNPQADVVQRHVDLKAMLDAMEPGEFLPLARKYGAEYLLLVEAVDGSGVAAVRPHHQRWACLRTEFVAADGSAVVYRIVDGTEGAMP